MFWKELFSKIDSYNIPYKDRKEIIKRIRQERYYLKLPRPENWEQRYGKIISWWAKWVIRKKI